MIWTVKATRVALPKTYHQLTFFGTGCWMMGRTAFENPSRRSNQAHDETSWAHPTGIEPVRISTWPLSTRES